jgi:hypothetical protein
VERFHWMLNAAIMCHADHHLTEALTLVLLEIRTTFKADLQASVAELVYGEPLRIPSELTPITDPVEPAHLISQLGQHMTRLRPVPAARHATPATFVHKDLQKYTHVFLHQSITHRALEPPPLRQLLPGPLREKENTATPRARQAPRPTQPRPSTTCHAAATRCKNFTHR